MLCAAPVELPAPSSLAGTPPGRHHPLTPATVDSAASVSYAEHSASLPRPPRSARPTRISLPRTTEPLHGKRARCRRGGPGRDRSGRASKESGTCKHKSSSRADGPSRCCNRTLWATPGPLRGVAGVVHVVRTLDAPIRVTSACWPFRTRRKHVDRGDLVTALRSEWKPFSSG